MTAPTVCLGLEKTLIYTIRPEDSALPESWTRSAQELTYVEDGENITCKVITRPGATELLNELHEYAQPMIYSSQSEEFIESILSLLSTVHCESNNSEEFREEDYERAEAFMDLYVWSQKQCANQEGKLIKSLGTLSEFSDNGINDIWLLDHQSTNVDFRDHLIPVPAFTGAPYDVALFNLLEDLFIH